MAGKTAGKGSPSEAQERLLVEAAQKDPARFADLYEQNFERVYVFILRRVRNRDETEDLTSEVFHKALANLARFRWRGVPFAAWLFRIAANLIADRMKREGRELVMNEFGAAEVAAAPASDEVELDAAAKCARLFRMVGQLPKDQRRVIELRFAEEKSIREIARQLKRSEGAVKQLQFRGLQRLRRSLGEIDG